jgi:hypothetical protein
MRRTAVALALVAASACGADGRSRFLLEQAPLALGWHGVAATVFLHPASVPAKAGVYAAGSATGYFTTLLLTSRFSLTEAQAHMGTAYAWRGALAGHSLDAWLKFGAWPGRVLGMWLASVAGEAGGLALARSMTTGQAAMVVTCTDIGLIHGLCAGTLINDFVFDDSMWHASPSVGMLPGEVVGALTGLAISRGRRSTEGQAFVVRAGAVVGTVVPGAMYYACTGRTGRRDQSIAAGIGLGTGTAGALLAAMAVAGRPLTMGEAWLVSAPPALGALAGAGAGYALRHDRRGAFGGGAAGACLGLAVGLAVPGRVRAGSGVGAGVGRRVWVDFGSLVAAAANLMSAQRLEAPRLVVARF